MPRIGVFWIYHGVIFGITERIEDGQQRIPKIYDSNLDHFKIWEQPGFLDKFPELKLREYSDIPRGRVLFSKPDATSIVYLDISLLNRSNKAKIIHFFDISSKKARWHADPHYTTNRIAIRNLLSEPRE